MLGRSLESLITIGVEWSSGFTFSVRDDNLAHLCLTYLSASRLSLSNIFSFALTPTFTITALPSSDTSLLASAHFYRRCNHPHQQLSTTFLDCSTQHVISCHRPIQRRCLDPNQVSFQVILLSMQQQISETNDL